MNKVIAILTQKGSLSKDIQMDTVVNIFRMEDEEVAEVEHLKMEAVSNNYFSLLMAAKKVSLVYLDSVNNDLKNMLNTLGITIKCKEEYTDDKFINRFVFD